MDLISESSQSVITCRNSQGTELTASLLRIKRYSVVFEVYNPYSILQLSEVLSDFRVMASRRLLYQGKAVVSNLLNTAMQLAPDVGLVNRHLRLAQLNLKGTTIKADSTGVNLFLEIELANG